MSRDDSSNREESYRKSDCRKVNGDKWHCPVIVEATPELIEEVRKENRRKNLLGRIINAFSHGDITDCLTLQDLEEIWVKLNPGEKEASQE